MLRVGLFVVAGDLLATCVQLVGKRYVAEHARGAFREHECVGMSRIHAEHVTGMKRRFIRPTRVEEHSCEMDPQREVVRSRRNRFFQCLDSARRQLHGLA